MENRRFRKWQVRRLCRCRFRKSGNRIEIRSGECREKSGGNRRASTRRVPSRVVASILARGLCFRAGHAHRELLLHPDVQDGLRHAPWQTGARSDGPMVPQHAMAENLVEPQHPARVLAAVDRQPPRTRKIPLRIDRQWCRRPRQKRRSISIRLRRRRPHLRLQLLRPGGRGTLQPAMDDAQLLAAIPVFDGRCVAAPALPDAETHDQLLPSSLERRA